MLSLELCRCSSDIFLSADHVLDWQPRTLLGMVEALMFLQRALEITRCKSIETTLRTRRLLWAEALIRMSGGRLPKSESCSETLRVQCGEDGVGRIRSGPIAYRETSRSFGIAGDWNATALEAE